MNSSGYFSDNATILDDDPMININNQQTKLINKTNDNCQISNENYCELVEIVDDSTIDSLYNLTKNFNYDHDYDQFF